MECVVNLKESWKGSAVLRMACAVMERRLKNLTRLERPEMNEFDTSCRWIQEDGGEPLEKSNSFVAGTRRSRHARLGAFLCDLK